MIDAKIKWLAFVSTIVGSIQLSAPALAQSYARDMFYQELKNPGVTATTNTHASTQHGHASTTSHSSAPSHGAGRTGLSFYIELVRDRRKINVDSRYHFKAGDQVKFHIVANTNGYAYVGLMQGSSGAQTLLYPIPGKDPTNQITRGRDYGIPQVTYLQFDNKPGREHIRIALTRQPLETSRFLSPTAQVAMASISSNPAIDPSGGQEQIKVSFKEDIPKPAPITRPAVQESAPEVSPPTNDTAITNAIPDNDNSSKDMFRNDSVPGGGGSSAHHSSYHPVHHAVRHTTYRPATTYYPPAPPPTTVVVNTNANEDLFMDIALEHD
jgi:hypothetical protein